MVTIAFLNVDRLRIRPNNRYLSDVLWLCCHAIHLHKLHFSTRSSALISVFIVLLPFGFYVRYFNEYDPTSLMSADRLQRMQLCFYHCRRFRYKQYVEPSIKYQITVIVC